MIRHTLLPAFTFLTAFMATPAIAETLIDPRANVPDSSLRIHDLKGYNALAALYRNAKSPAKVEDFILLQTTATQDSRQAPNPSEFGKCRMVGVRGEKPSRPFSSIWANRINPAQGNGKPDIGPFLSDSDKEFIFLGSLGTGEPFPLKNALAQRDGMGWTEETSTDLIIHAEELNPYYNSKVNIYLRKNGDFIAFCLRRNDRGGKNECEPDYSTSPMFSTDNLIVYGYCYNTESKRETADLTQIKPATHLSGQGDESSFSKVMGKYGNNLYFGSAAYIFSGRNLALATEVRYTPTADESRIRFALASQGNHELHGYPAYPIDGLVDFRVAEMDEASGTEKLVSFLDSETKKPVSFERKPFTFYVNESEDSFQDRRLRAQSDRLAPPQGPFFAIVTWSFGHQDIRFYEKLPSTDPSHKFVLKPFGSFHGDALPPYIQRGHYYRYNYGSRYYGY